MAHYFPLLQTFVFSPLTQISPSSHRPYVIWPLGAVSLIFHHLPSILCALAIPSFLLFLECSSPDSHKTHSFLWGLCSEIIPQRSFSCLLNIRDHLLLLTLSYRGLPLFQVYLPLTPHLKCLFPSPRLHKLCENPGFHLPHPEHLQQCWVQDTHLRKWR